MYICIYINVTRSLKVYQLLHVKRADIMDFLLCKILSHTIHNYYVAPYHRHKTGKRKLIGNFICFFRLFGSPNNRIFSNFFQTHLLDSLAN